VELAQIEGGEEGVFSAISKISKYIARLKNIDETYCIVHAINCAKPNLKLRNHLEKIGFTIQNISNKGEAYFKIIDIDDFNSENRKII